MSRFRFNTQMLSRCGATWLRGSPVAAPLGTIMAVPHCHSIRHVSTTRPKKAQAMKESLKETAAAMPTAKALKSSTSAKTRKSPTKATAAAAAAAAAAVEKEVKTTTQAKKTEATKATPVKTKATSSAAAEPKPRAAAKTTITAKSAPASAPAPAPKSTANITIPPPIPRVQTPEQAVPISMSANKKPSAAPQSGRFPPSQHHAAPKPKPAAAPVSSRPSPVPTPSSNPLRPGASNNFKPKVDTSSPEYKQAAWKWTSTMIALPILLVTSYLLFDRLALGNHPTLDEYREKIRGLTASGPAKTEASGDEVQTSNTA